MRLVVIAVSRLRSGPEQELVDRFTDRIRRAGRQAGINKLDIIEIEESRNQETAGRKRQEAEKLRQSIPAGSFVVALDERGKSLSSRKFSEQFTRWRDAGYPAICFLIGGPDGLESDLRTDANLVLSFGEATWPHKLVRVMLMEQLYRATTLLLNHPYHRD